MPVCIRCGQTWDGKLKTSFFGFKYFDRPTCQRKVKQPLTNDRIALNILAAIFLGFLALNIIRNGANQSTKSELLQALTEPVKDRWRLWPLVGRPAATNMQR